MKIYTVKNVLDILVNVLRNVDVVAIVAIVAIAGVEKICVTSVSRSGWGSQ